MSINRELDKKKLWYIYYSATEKNKIMPFEATWMDLEINILRKVSRTENDTYHMISFRCGI